MKRKLLALSVLFISMVGVCSADQCRVINGQTVCQTAQVQTVVTQPVITTSAIALPIYGAAYQASATDDETKILLKQLLDEMKAMRADLANHSSGGSGAPSANAAKQIDVLALFKRECAQCHTGDKSKGGFMMFTDKGELVRWSPADRRELTRQIEKNLMPKPPKKLTTAEKDAILKEVK